MRRWDSEGQSGPAHAVQCASSCHLETNMRISDMQRKDLVAFLGNVAASAKWHCPTNCERETVTPHLLREIYKEGGRPPGSWRVHSYLLCDDLLPPSYEQLTRALRKILVQYISPKSDWIGCGIDDVLGKKEPTIFNEFVKELVRGATLLGPERAVTFLGECIEQKTICFECHGVIQDANIVEQPMAAKGMEIKTLPKDREELPNALKVLSIADGEILWPGGCMLSVKCEFHPDFFVPTESGKRCGLDGRGSFSPDYPEHPPRVLLERIAIAMSLATDSNVGLTPRWLDYGDLQAFRQTQSGGAIFRASMYSQVRITGGTIRDTQEILDLLPTNLSDEDRIVEVIRILRSSFGRFSMLHRLGSIRTALDILFGSYEKQMGRRAIAAAGADVLAVDKKEHTKICQDLCNFYGFASDVVHGKPIEDSNSADCFLRCAQGYVKRAVIMWLEKDRAGSD